MLKVCPGRHVCVAGDTELEGVVLAGELAQELALVHAVFEGLAAIDEDYGNFIIELAAEVGVGIDVDFLPGESPAPGEFGQALLDYLTEMTALAGIHHDGATCQHRGDSNARN